MPKSTVVTPLRTWQIDQSWFAQKEVRHAATGLVLRATIRRNAYDDQSYARVETLEMPMAKWNGLLSRQIRELSCHTLSYQSPFSQQLQRTLDADLDRLLAAADTTLTAAIRKAA